MGKRKAWSKAEDESLILYRKEGKSYSGCADLLNRSARACMSRAVRLGITDMENVPQRLRPYAFKRQVVSCTVGNCSDYTASGTAVFPLLKDIWLDCAGLTYTGRRCFYDFV